MRYSITALLMAIAFVSLAGCGQTGPLYMPPETAPKTAPETVPETVPQAQPAAPADIAEQPTQEP